MIPVKTTGQPQGGSALAPPATGGVDAEPRRHARIGGKTFQRRLIMHDHIDRRLFQQIAMRFLVVESGAETPGMFGSLSIARGYTRRGVVSMRLQPKHAIRPRVHDPAVTATTRL